MSMRRTLLYARCSTKNDQRPEVQIEELRNYANARGWKVEPEHIIIDEGISGRTPDRPGFNKLMVLARERKVDTVLILKLDRLFRSLKHIIITLEEFSEIGIELISIKENLDMTTSAGRLMVHIISAFSQFEAELARERTLIGLDYCRSKGIKLGRPQAVNYELILRLRSEGLSYRQIQNKIGCSSWAVRQASKGSAVNAPTNVLSAPIITVAGE